MWFWKNLWMRIEGGPFSGGPTLSSVLDIFTTTIDHWTANFTTIFVLYRVFQVTKFLQGGPKLTSDWTTPGKLLVCVLRISLTNRKLIWLILLIIFCQKSLSWIPHHFSKTPVLKLAHQSICQIEFPVEINPWKWATPTQCFLLGCLLFWKNWQKSVFRHFLGK